jgi:hypothetical protein
VKLYGRIKFLPKYFIRKFDSPSHHHQSFYHVSSTIVLFCKTRGSSSNRRDVVVSAPMMAGANPKIVSYNPESRLVRFEPPPHTHIFFHLKNTALPFTALALSVVVYSEVLGLASVVRVFLNCIGTSSRLRGTQVHLGVKISVGANSRFRSLKKLLSGAKLFSVISDTRHNCLKSFLRLFKFIFY